MNRHRTFIIGIMVGFLSLLFSAPALSSNTEPVRPIIDSGDSLGASYYLAQLQSQSRIYLQAADTSRRPPSLDMGERAQQTEKDLTPKSPLRAFLYSALIPGAGQWYNGSKFKAAVFLGLEALTWTGHIVYHGKGDDKTAEFENFADIHWSENRYGDFLEYNWGVRDDEDTTISPPFTHHLPDSKTQQYYEMIGKYDQFVFGWDDVNTDLTPPDVDNLGKARSANREHYEDMRHEANKMYDRASSALIVTMANHLISGVEAALAARSHNKNIEEMARRVSFRAILAGSDEDYYPMLTMSYTF